MSKGAPRPALSQREHIGHQKRARTSTAARASIPTLGREGIGSKCGKELNTIKKIASWCGPTSRARYVHVAPLEQFQVALNRSSYFSLTAADLKVHAKGTRAEGGRTWAGAPDGRRAARD